MLESLGSHPIINNMETSKEFKAENLRDVEVEDTHGYPEFPDAWVSAAEWKDGTPLTEGELEILNNDSALVWELVWDRIH